MVSGPIRRPQQNGDRVTRAGTFPTSFPACSHFTNFAIAALSTACRFISYLTYSKICVSPKDKPLAWLREEIRSPPLSRSARLQMGFLLRLLQRGEVLGMPHSRPMQSIAPRCHELRVADRDAIWRLIYRIDKEAIVVIALFNKKTAKTPKAVIDLCKRRLSEYDSE